MINFDKKTVLSLLFVALTWCVFGLLIILATQDSVVLYRSVKWMIGLWVLCLADLVSLAKVVALIFGFLSNQDTDLRLFLSVQMIFWAVAKLLCLVVLGAVLLLGKNIPALALVVGLGTCIIVPLFWGLWWFYRVRKDLQCTKNILLHGCH